MRSGLWPLVSIRVECDNDQSNTDKDGERPMEDLTSEQWMNLARACCPRGPRSCHPRGRLAKKLSKGEEFLRSVRPPSDSIIAPTSVPMEAGGSANARSSYMSASECAKGPSPREARVNHAACHIATLPYLPAATQLWGSRGVAHVRALNPSPAGNNRGSPHSVQGQCMVATQPAKLNDLLLKYVLT
ncbi:Serine/threonine-protein phosphatase 7 long form-like protein [Senna tora]|uniref:Serine/threonine-protein phosphatase 7 long form-like protein n=1 Tax=Senna tora TaxID=362788 RepID=A0A834SDZ0_9FABA|nr:Serine/threonine-protein phosphatase 7 long form-like protein [Senna tora]